MPDNVTPPAGEPYCLICGAGPFMRVGSHVWQIHGVRSAEYRRRYPGAVMTPPELHGAWVLELTERGLIPRRRGRYCRRGHALRGANVIEYANGSRTCRTCTNARGRVAARDPITCAECGRIFQPRPMGGIPKWCPECRQDKQRAAGLRWYHAAGKQRRAERMAGAAKRKEKNVKSQRLSCDDSAGAAR